MSYVLKKVLESPNHDFTLVCHKGFVYEILQTLHLIIARLFLFFLPLIVVITLVAENFLEHLH